MKDTKGVPYYIHEGELVRMERNSRRIWALTVGIIASMVVNNMMWLRKIKK